MESSAKAARLIARPPSPRVMVFWGARAFAMLVFPLFFTWRRSRARDEYLAVLWVSLIQVKTGRASPVRCANSGRYLRLKFLAVFLVLALAASQVQSTAAFE